MGGANSKSDETNPVALISRKTGNWWQDDRRNWCAYCGRPIDFSANKAGQAMATRDHVIPKSHKIHGVKIPACRPCNTARGAISLPEFLAHPYFDNVRKKCEADTHAWSLRNLWLVLAYVAAEQAYRHSDEWVGGNSDRHNPG
jgi:hypothetical protein